MPDNDTSVNVNGCSLFGAATAATLILAILKIAGVLHITWLTVAIPLLAGVAWGVCLFIVFTFLLILAEFFKTK